MNGRFIGHADEMNGPMKRMVLEPGTYKIELLQAGYQPVEDAVILARFELKARRLVDDRPKAEYAR